MPLQAPPAVWLGLDLRARLRVVQRRSAIFFTTLVGCLALGAVITVRAPRVYKASSTVFIEINTPDVLSGVKDFYDIGASYWASKEYYETQYRVIASRPVAQRVVAALGLQPETVVAAVRELPPSSWQTTLAGDGVGLDAPVSVRDKLHILGLDGVGRERLLATLPKLDPVAAMMQRVLVAPVRQTRLVEISVEDTQPHIAALLANAVVDAYIDTNLEQKVGITRSAVTWLSDQGHELKHKLEASEEALQQFRKDNDILSVSLQEHQTMVAQSLGHLNGQLSLERAQGFSLRARMRQLGLQQAGEGPTPDNFVEATDSAYLEKVRATYFDLRQQEDELRLAYTPSHPKRVAMQRRVDGVQQALRSEAKRQHHKLEVEFAQNQENQQALQREIERLKDESQAFNRKEVEYTRLHRDYDTNLALYDVVLRREKEANIAQMLKLNNVRKLESAQTPEHPVRPRVHINMIVSLLAGLFVSTFLVCSVDYLDNRVKSQDQVEQMIGLPFFGIVPRIRVGGDDALLTRDLHMVDNPRSVFAECWRVIRTNLVFTSADRPLHTLLVCSHGPREGKSTTAINLSVTMALLGSRTLLVDADMRRPRLHRTFGLDNSHGLSDLIVGEATMDEAVVQSGIERLDVLPCGPVPPNPAELLHTANFGALLERLRERYDRIIFDSPPVGAVSDALVLGSWIDGAVLVLHAGRSSWQNALRTRLRFETIRRPILGVVLNNVDLDRYSAREYYYYLENEPHQNGAAARREQHV